MEDKPPLEAAAQKVTVGRMAARGSCYGAQATKSYTAEAEAGTSGRHLAKRGMRAGRRLGWRREQKYTYLRLGWDSFIVAIGSGAQRGARS